MPATIVSSTPKTVYAPVGKNLAPTYQLEALGKKHPQQNKFCDAIRERYEQYRNRDNQTWQETLDVGKMVSNLRNGKLLLLRHAIDNRYLFVKKDGRYSDNKTVGGLFQFYSTKLTAEWLSSKPERDPVCPSDEDQIEEFIAGVKIIQDYYDKRFFDDTYETKESLSAQDFGMWITRFRFDPDIQDIVCELLDLPACRWDIRFRPEESSFFIYESKCATSVLSKLLDADVPEDGTETPNYGLKIIEQIARQGGNASGDGKEHPNGTYNTVEGETVVTEMWLQPEAYCDIELNEDEPTIGGIDLPKGNRLLEIFPEGMVVVGIQGLKTIFGLYAENVKDHIVSGVYHLQSFSGMGKGISDAVDVKKEMDDLHSQTMAYIKSHGTPSWGYNQNMVSEEQARNIGKPRKIIPFDFTNAPDGVKSINEAVQALVPGNPASGVWEMGKTMENYLQMAMQVTNFSDGMPGVDNKTATGAQIGDANARTLLVPQHRNKADHRKRADKVIYNLFKRFKNQPKFFATRDLNGITKGRYLSGEDFNDVDIEFEIVADSEVPKTPYSKEMSLTKLLNFTGGVTGLIEAAAANPEMTSKIATGFGADLPIAKQNDIARVCRKRIEQAKQILEQELELQKIMVQVTGEAPDNSNLPLAIVSQLKPPIYSKEPYYQQKVAWLSELLDNDELMYAPEEMRWVIGEMIDRHLQEATLGQAQMAQDQNMATIMANLPTLLGEQLMNQQNQQMTQQYAQEQAVQQQQQQLAQRAQEAEISEKTSEAEHNRAKAMQDDSHTKQLQLESIKQLGQLEAAKSKKAA
jgi:hypothetical protein